MKLGGKNPLNFVACVSRFPSLSYATCSNCPHHLCIRGFVLLDTFGCEMQTDLTAKTHKQEEMNY